ATRRRHAAWIRNARGHVGLRRSTVPRALVGGLHLAFRAVVVRDTAGEGAASGAVIPRDITLEVAVTVVVTDLDRLPARIDPEQADGAVGPRAELHLAGAERRRRQARDLDSSNDDVEGRTRREPVSTHAESTPRGGRQREAGATASAGRVAGRRQPLND